jgi:hypothetical protein
MVPVFVEGMGYLGGDWPHGQHIEVDKHSVCFELKVLIGDIAAADDADRIVYRKRFIVHTPVRLTELADKVECIYAAPGNGIEYSDLDIGVLIHQQKTAIGNGGKYVIQQETDPNAPIRGFEQRVGHHGAGGVEFH